MSRKRSNAMDAEDEEEFLASERQALCRTESFDMEELIFADRQGRLEIPLFQTTCCKKNNQQWDKNCEILLIGANKVGKTAIVKRYSEGTYAQGYNTTLGIENTRAYIHVSKNLVRQSIIDTSGEPEVSPLLQHYYGIVDAVLLVYDIRRPDSLEYIEKALKNLPANIPKIICANKADRTIRIDAKARLFASKHSVEIYETCCRYGDNINEVFYHLTRKVLGIQPQASNSNTNCAVMEPTAPRRLRPRLLKQRSRSSN